MGIDENNPDRESASSAGSYPAAPLPPHERTWRHPSEVGLTQRVVAENPSSVAEVGRGVVGVSVLLGVCLVVGLVILSRPSSGESDAATVVRLTSADLAYARISANRDAQPPMAVRVGDSDVLVTTQLAVGDEEQIDAFMADGGKASLEVAYVDPVSSIAVLVSGDDTARPGAALPSRAVDLGQDVIVLSETPLRLRVDSITGHVAMLTSNSSFDPAAVAEGAPVVDQSGQLVGICTHVGERLAIVMTNTISDVLADVFAND